MGRTSSTPVPGKRRKREKSSTSELEQVYVQYLRDRQEVMREKEKNLDPEEEADKQWLLSLLSNFKGMERRAKNKLKYKIQGLFLEDDSSHSTSRPSTSSLFDNVDPTYHQLQTINFSQM
jgi:hypothetical protein